MASVRKVALVTGAGSGIGRAAAVALLREGWSVVLVGRRAEALAETAALAPGSRTLCLPADVTDAAAVRAVFDRTVAEFGRLDLLFNNAGIGAPAVPLDELKLETWQRVVDVNLTGAFYCLREAFRLMKTQTPRGGRIINNGSISAHTPRLYSAAYTATKHAITGLTKAAALEGRSHDIAVGQIDIGNAETPLTAKMKDGVLQADGSRAAEPTIDVDHVGREIAHIARLPLDVNVLFVTIMATKMPFVGRG
jgi:NAD(P)-dependent dehydrogenase (short-subunit alcohol dehydrogenase family)